MGSFSLDRSLIFGFHGRFVENLLCGDLFGLSLASDLLNSALLLLCDGENLSQRV